MGGMSSKAHWENVYPTKRETEVSWFQDNSAPSLELIAMTGVPAEAAIIDMGSSPYN
jgi:hypothetical protein